VLGDEIDGDASEAVWLGQRLSRDQYDRRMLPTPPKAYLHKRWVGVTVADRAELQGAPLNDRAHVAVMGETTSRQRKVREKGCVCFSAMAPWVARRT